MLTVQEKKEMGVGGLGVNGGTQNNRKGKDTSELGAWQVKIKSCKHL
jgi:hypothetical protein